MTPTMGVRAAVTVGLCAASLGLAACGGDDDSSRVTDGSLGEEVRSQLETAGIAGEDADCIVEEINATVSDEEFQNVLDEAEESGDAEGTGAELLGPKFAAAVKECGVTPQAP